MTSQGAPFKHGWRSCIFCGEPGKITKEHIWPRWIRSHIEFDEDAYVAAAAHVYPDRHEIVSTKRFQGDPRSRGVPVVCSKCNNGWMSALQTSAKPFLTPMITGQGHLLSVDEQGVLAAWAAMAVMVGEFFFPPEVVVTTDIERRAFSRQRAAPATWKIWLGAYERRVWRAHFARSTRYLHFPGMPEPEGGDVPERNTMTATLVVGTAFFHIFRCPSVQQTANVFMDEKDGRLMQIWPTVAGLIWPTPMLTDSDADSITSVIFEFIDKTYDSRADIASS